MRICERDDCLCEVVEDTNICEAGHQQPRFTIGGASSALAAAILKKSLERGESIEIPSLGIVIPGKKRPQ